MSWVGTHWGPIWTPFWTHFWTPFGAPFRAVYRPLGSTAPWIPRYRILGVLETTHFGVTFGPQIGPFWTSSGHGQIRFWSHYHAFWPFWVIFRPLLDLQIDPFWTHIWTVWGTWPRACHRDVLPTDPRGRSLRNPVHVLSRRAIHIIPGTTPFGGVPFGPQIDPK